jgi:ribosomal 30S subunit maturation factor RimM
MTASDEYDVKYKEVLIPYIKEIFKQLSGKHGTI